MTATSQIDRRSLLTGAAAGTTIALIGAGGASAQKTADDLTRLMDAERAVIRSAMAQKAVSAVAVCLVSRGRPAWIEGFGRTSGANGMPVAADTMFSIQSTSKNFAAVAALVAVQEGLLELDKPISDYVPDFTVNSRFEESPQERITLRLLLSHRAGFTHEAPVGNNYEPTTPSFKAHIHSISDTWLRSPVGDRYRYSNLGYDLVGAILERATGVDYAEWLRRKIFAPLGMNDSTADPAVYAKVANRATGSAKGYSHVPLVTPLAVSGGVYTSARDMAAYASFLLAGGKWQQQQILAPELWSEMHGFGLGGDYSLGVIRNELRYGSTPVRLLSHRGGGFGFGCVFTYCPEAEFGWAALFNSSASAGYHFGEKLIDGLLVARFGARTPRLPASDLASVRPTASQAATLVGNYVGRNVLGKISGPNGQLRFDQDETETHVELKMTSPNDLFISDTEGETVCYRYHAATAALPAHLECSEGEASLDYNEGPSDPTGLDRPQWVRYVGRYRVDQWGKPAMDVVIERRRGYLYINGIRLMVEHLPGLFFTSDGEAVDFRPTVPTWRSLLLHRV